MTRSSSPYLFALAAATLFFLIGLATLNQIGLTWDAPENLLTGQHYARFFITGDASWLDFAAYDEQYRMAAETRPLLYNREFNAPFRYPPVANIAAAATHALFTTHLGWLADTDGYHLAVLLFATLTLLVLTCFTWQAFGKIASFAATLALATYPLFFEHAHHNLKDVPFAAFVLLALWAYWQGERHGRWRWFLLAAVAAGLGMGVRVLAVAVWIVIGLAYLPVAWANRQLGWQAMVRPYRPMLLCIPLSLFIFLAAWPWLWPDPSGRLAEHLVFGRDVSRGLRVLYNGQMAAAGKTLPWHYSAVIFSLTTPLLVLIGGLVGCGAAVKRNLRQPDTAAFILLTLFLLALIRSSWPGIPHYDGTRHMLDGIVAFAGLFGLGFQVIWEKSVARRSRRGAEGTLRHASAPLLLCLLLFLPLILVNIRLHPFQGIFYNVLAGGTTGAYDRFPQEYWGSSFRLGTAWVNENALQTHWYWRVLAATWLASISRPTSN
jgi:4-amino-4-deoxy-L-arabinose transferase-like glycosyltransferase